MSMLTTALSGESPPGLYRLPPTVDVTALSEICQSQGWRLVHLDGTFIANKTELLRQTAAAMNFPDYFGQNWDALEDCLTDLDWLAARQYVLLFTQPENFARTAATDWQTLLEILQDVVAFWRETDTPMYVLFQTADLGLVNFPMLE